MFARAQRKCLISRMKPRSRWSERYRLGKRKKIRHVRVVYQLLDAYNPKYSLHQKWYVEEVKEGMLIALILDPRTDGKVVLHSALVIVPHDAPSKQVEMVGIAAALGLAEVEFGDVEKHLLPMNDLCNRLWNGSVKNFPFSEPSSKWSPVMLTETIGKLSQHGCWPIVAGWDTKAPTNPNLTKLMKSLGCSELKAFKQKLRSIHLPCADWEFVAYKCRVFGVEHIKNQLVTIWQSQGSDNQILGGEHESPAGQVASPSRKPRQFKQSQP